MNVPVPQPAVPAEIQDIAGFSVTEPVKAGHITYTVKGIDEEGEFMASRRYSDFYALREHLQKHWPGVFIPPIPPKKTTGNKDDSFVEDRCEFLDRFIKLIAKNPALVLEHSYPHPVREFVLQNGKVLVKAPAPPPPPPCWPRPFTRKVSAT